MPIFSGAGLLSAGLNLIGGLIENDSNASMAESTNAFNAQQAQYNRDFQAEQAGKQMQFQERMANTSYQRAVRDLARAGLNPMLAYHNGGAPVPSGAKGEGSQAAGVTATMHNALGDAVSSGIHAESVKSAIELQKEQVKSIEADVALKSEQAEKTSAEIDNVRAQTATQLVTADKLRQDTVTSASQARYLETHADLLHEQINKVAPEIREMLSRSNLNEAQVTRIAGELPLIAAQVPKIKAETLESHQRRFLTQVEMKIKDLKTNEATAYSDFYGSAYGHASPYVNSGTKVFNDIVGAVTPLKFFKNLGGGSAAEVPHRTLNQQPGGK